LSLSLKRVEGGGVTQRADELEPVEGTPNLDLSEEVFSEGQPEPVAEALPEEPTSDIPAAEPAAEEADASIEADQEAPEEPGPGDSESEPPAPPEPE
jgi:hypothetical protein